MSASTVAVAVPIASSADVKSSVAAASGKDEKYPSVPGPDVPLPSTRRVEWPDVPTAADEITFALPFTIRYGTSSADKSGLPGGAASRTPQSFTPSLEVSKFLHAFVGLECLSEKWQFNSYGIGWNGEPKVMTFKRFEQRAAAGDLSAMNNAGACLLMKYGVKKDGRRAFQYFETAAARGNRSARHNLGVCYALGAGLRRREPEAAYNIFAELAGATATQPAVPMSIACLGTCHQVGIGTGTDPKLALAYYERAYETGLVRSLHLMGLAKYYAVGQPKDLNAAVAFYERGCTHGYVLSSQDVASYYSETGAPHRNDAKAVKYYLMAAQRGWSTAQNFLARRLDHGVGCEKDPLKAVEWYTRATQHGPKNNRKSALLLLGRGFVFGVGVKPDVPRGIEIFKRCAKLGSTDAMLELGSLYEYGLNRPTAAAVSASIAAASAIIAAGNAAANTATAAAAAAATSAATASTATAATASAGGAAPAVSPAAAVTTPTTAVDAAELLRVTIRERELSTLAIDTKEAFDWYLQASNANSADGCYQVAMSYGYGMGVEVDHRQALVYYEKAVKLGHAAATNNCAIYYENARGGCERNLPRAFELYRSAAILGLPSAMYNCGECYYYGYGVHRNVNIGMMWYWRSGRTGNPKAKAMLGSLFERKKLPLFDLPMPELERTYQFNAGGVAGVVDAGADDIDSSSLDTPPPPPPPLTDSVDIPVAPPTIATSRELRFQTVSCVVVVAPPPPTAADTASAVLVDTDPVVYVCDRSAACIYKLSAAVSVSGLKSAFAIRFPAVICDLLVGYFERTYVGSVLAGCPHKTGLADGSASQARFKVPTAMTHEPAVAGDGAGAAGVLYVTDAHRIRRVRCDDGTVTTVSGNRLGYSGLENGPLSSALYFGLSGIVRDARTGALLVTDFVNGKTRKVVLSGDGAVTTLIPSPAGAHPTKRPNLYGSTTGGEDAKKPSNQFTAIGLTADPKTGHLYMIEHTNALSCESISKFDSTSGDLIATLPLCMTFRGVNALLYVPYTPPPKPVFRRTASELARAADLKKASTGATATAAATATTAAGSSDAAAAAPAVDDFDPEIDDPDRDAPPVYNSVDSGLAGRLGPKRPADRGSFFIAAKNLLYHYHYSRQIVTLICRLAHKISSVAFDGEHVFVGCHRARHLLRFPFNPRAMIALDRSYVTHAASEVPTAASSASTKATYTPAASATPTKPPLLSAQSSLSAIPTSPHFVPASPIHLTEAGLAGMPPLTGLDLDDQPSPAPAAPPRLASAPSGVAASVEDGDDDELLLPPAPPALPAPPPAVDDDRKIPPILPTDPTLPLDAERDLVIAGFAAHDIPRPTAAGFDASVAVSSVSEYFDIADADNPYY